MNKNDHVYCTKCKHGEELLNRIASSKPFVEPKNSKGCCCFNPEDSMKFEERPNYKRLVS